MNTNYQNTNYYKFLQSDTTNTAHLKTSEIKRLSYLNSVYKLMAYADERARALRGAMAGNGDSK